MSQQLFDRPEEYEAMLNEGISLSGEGQEYFILGRTQDLRKQLQVSPMRILDFGCGAGKTCGHLAILFPEASITGIDLSEDAIAHARKIYGSERITFALLADLPKLGTFDLCYVNGVFHHIHPDDRQATLRMIKSVLAPRGHLAVFENNPWNPGTRMVMRRIPFDRDAVPLSFLELRNRMKEVGYEVLGSRFLFYLPKYLALFRFIERPLVRIPLGAQYYVLGRVPAGTKST